MAANAIKPPLSTTSGLTPKNAGFHRPNQVRHAVGDGWIDGVLGDVALDARVVVLGRVAGQTAALELVLVRGLPGAQDDFAYSTHRLRVRRDHAQCTDVVQPVHAGD